MPIVQQMPYLTISESNNSRQQFNIIIIIQPVILICYNHYLSENIPDPMPAYDTMMEALKDLKDRGFTTDFNLAFDAIECRETGVCLRPEAFEIVEHYRFEGETNPSDSSIVYAVKAKDGNMKGVLVNAYGVYSEAASDDMIRKLSVHERR
jgi:hypothetical protein